MKRQLTPPILRRTLGAVVAAAFAVLASPAALAQVPTDKPIRIVAAGPAGATTDIVARLLADGLQKELNQTVVVDPKPGAGGAVAVNDLMQAPHDGHTVLVALNALVSEIPHIVKLRFDMAKEIKPLAELGRAGIVMVGHPSVPAKSLGEVISYVKTSPGKVSYASYSAGTLSHVMGLQLNKAAGIDMSHVGYKGSTPALTDVMGGHVPLMFDGIPTAIPMIKAGKIVPYAVSLPQRSPLLPNVPTFAELGYPQLEATGWQGLWVTPDVPAAAQNRLREAALKVMAQPATRERLRELGLEPGQPRTPDELVKSLRVDYDRVGAVLKSIDFKPE
ncbi:Bug family tripartite tricarboxylate transporter substrate binding protein [Variovorax saccharolyticus]|uniref:Bug family tripartite tricarboxylate transporter substrate binding protein n=1 Tax=Variovorax saccharolyticus TaxID=3053516 RepID=UPI0025757BA7|nr:tripartite tricarboxylate transporter substrate binding protein [Variovorax sp. J22R187]MDM0022398.1 tripartite tricarboxylate transporter substrate binding protein [Variovorax sp. J22R187]